MIEYNKNCNGTDIVVIKELIELILKNEFLFVGK